MNEISRGGGGVEVEGVCGGDGSVLVVIKKMREDEGRWKRKSKYLRLMRPLISQLIQDIQLTKRTEYIAHQATLAHSLLDRIEPLTHHSLRAYDTRNARCDFSQRVERPRDGFLPTGHRLRELLGSVQSRIDYRYWNHPNAMLHTWRQHCDFRKEPLIRWPCHDLVGVAFAATIWTSDNDGGTELLEEMPACTGDGEEVEGVGDVAEDVECGVVLKQEVKLDADATDVLEHGAELHVLGVGAEAVKS